MYPATLQPKLEIKILCEKGYELKKSVMVDMFPHTPHIENIVLFSKQGL